MKQRSVGEMTNQWRVLVKAEVQKKENFYISYATESVRFTEAVSRCVKLESCLWEPDSSFHVAVHTLSYR